MAKNYEKKITNKQIFAQMFTQMKFVKIGCDMTADIKIGLL